MRIFFSVRTIFKWIWTCSPSLIWLPISLPWYPSCLCSGYRNLTVNGNLITSQSAGWPFTCIISNCIFAAWKKFFVHSSYELRVLAGHICVEYGHTTVCKIVLLQIIAVPKEFTSKHVKCFLSNSMTAGNHDNACFIEVLQFPWLILCCLPKCRATKTALDRLLKR